MTTSRPQVNSSPQSERRRNPRLLILVLVVLCALFVAGYVERLSQLETVRESASTMQQQIAASKQRNATLREELKRAQDPYYLALMARDDIGLVQDGDLPVVVYDAKSAASGAPAADAAPQQMMPPKTPWQQWLELIFPMANSR